MGETQEINIPAEESSTDGDAHTQAMLDKADAGTNTDGASKDDTLLAGKYKTPEELNKGLIEILKKQTGEDDVESIYKKLESGMGSQTDEMAEGDPQNETDSDSENSDESEEENKGEEEETSSGTLDFSDFESEWAENGELSDATYEKLAKEHGIPKDIVDEVIEMRVEKAQKIQAELTDIFGGDAEYKNAVEWAKSNYSTEQIENYNKALFSGNLDTMRMAVKALNADYVQDNGSSPRNLLNGKTTNSSVTGYRSVAEMQADMNNPKYLRDEAFRNEVMRKIQFSKIMN